MIKGILRRLREKQAEPSTDHGPTIDRTSKAALIARRGMRVSNRNARLAAAYEAAHMRLEAGPKT